LVQYVGAGHSDVWLALHRLASNDSIHDSTLAQVIESRGARVQELQVVDGQYEVRMVVERTSHWVE
jgi:hypothetical protein